MDVLAALGDAPTAAIAVIAIMLGVFLAARGQRGAVEAGGDAAGEAAPARLKVPISGPSAPDEDGLQSMAIGDVGHGAIRLGGSGPRMEAQPDAPALPALPALPAREPEPPAAPEEPAAPPQPWQPPSSAQPPGPPPFRQGTIRLRKPGE